MRPLHLVFASSVTFGLSTAALALPAADTAPGAPRRGAAESYAGTAITRGGVQLICVHTYQTGSRVRQPICRSEQEWAQSGARVERHRQP